MFLMTLMLPGRPFCYTDSQFKSTKGCFFIFIFGFTYCASSVCTRLFAFGINICSHSPAPRSSHSEQTTAGDAVLHVSVVLGCRSVSQEFSYYILRETCCCINTHKHTAKAHLLVFACPTNPSLPRCALV